MGIDLNIRGRYGGRIALFAPGGSELLSKIHDWWQRNHGDVLMDRHRFLGTWEDRPTLGLCLHPSAENVIFTTPRRGRIEVSAKTSTVGPGYHMFVCDALNALAEEFRIVWDEPSDESFDEALYFHTGNPSDVHQGMRNFVRIIATQAISQADGTDCQLSMATDWRFVVPGAAAVTPLGPRDRAWMEGAAADGARGIDIFPWWHRGTGAHYWLGRALVQMWSEVRWREPIADEHRDMLEEVHVALGKAYRAEPRLTYPWREWSEIAQWLDVDDELSRVVRENAAAVPDELPRIGYRRGDGVASITHGWSARVPGSFAEEWDEDTWVAWEPGRWVRVMTFTSDGGAHAMAEKKNHEIVAQRHAEAIPLPDGSTAALFHGRDDDDHEHWTLQAVIAGADTDTAFALCTISFDDDSHRAWAIATLESVRWAEPYEPQTVVFEEE